MDVIGIFRLHTREFISTRYVIVLSRDAMVFFRTGSELTGSPAEPLDRDDLAFFSSASEDELLKRHKKNFRIPLSDVIAVRMKRSPFGLNGPRIGVLSVTGMRTSNFDIGAGQDFAAIQAMIEYAMPGKLAVVGSQSSSQPKASLQRKTAVRMGEVFLPREEGNVRNASNWLYWIAGLSIVNYVIIMFGGQWIFFAGLGFTQLLSDIASEVGRSSVGLVATGLTIFFAAVFALMGYLGRQARTWPFIGAIVLYVLDLVVCLWFRDWLGAGFHILAGYFLIVGTIAGIKISRSRSRDSNRMPY